MGRALRRVDTPVPTKKFQHYCLLQVVALPAEYDVALEDVRRAASLIVHA